MINIQANHFSGSPGGAARFYSPGGGIALWGGRDRWRVSAAGRSQTAGPETEPEPEPHLQPEPEPEPAPEAATTPPPGQETPDEEPIISPLFTLCGFGGSQVIMMSLLGLMAMRFAGRRSGV